MTDYNQCNLCNSKKDSGNSENPINHPTSWWEIWKTGGETYQVFTELETVEKIILPKLINKHPTEYNKQKTIISNSKRSRKRTNETCSK